MLLMLALKMATSIAAEPFHLLHTFYVGCMSRISVSTITKIQIKEQHLFSTIYLSVAFNHVYPFNCKLKIWIHTPVIKPIALSCKSCMLSTKKVVKLVFSSCRTQLSDNFSINKKSLSKPRIVQSFCSIAFTAPETLSRKKLKQ